MTSDEGDAVAYAAGIRRALGCGETPTIEGLVHRATGSPVGRASFAVTEVTVSNLNHRPVLYVNARLPAARARWCVAWAFAGWAMLQDKMPEGEIRRLRARVAGDLLLPADIAARAFRKASPAAVAVAFSMPLATALLREAEVTRVPTALVVPGRYVRVRGDDAGRLPTGRAALELLAGRRGIGIARYQVPEEGGVVLRVAA